jgi:hypothetical protein
LLLLDHEAELALLDFVGVIAQPKWQLARGARLGEWVAHS